MAELVPRRWVKWAYLVEAAGWLVLAGTFLFGRPGIALVRFVIAMVCLGEAITHLERGDKSTEVP